MGFDYFKGLFCLKALRGLSDFRCLWVCILEEFKEYKEFDEFQVFDFN